MLVRGSGEGSECSSIDSLPATIKADILVS